MQELFAKALRPERHNKLSPLSPGSSNLSDACHLYDTVQYRCLGLPALYCVSRKVGSGPYDADGWSRIMSSFDFATTVRGKMYQGQFTVTRDGITVTSEFGKKTLQVGRTPPKILARMILAEIVSDDLRRRGLSYD